MTARLPDWPERVKIEEARSITGLGERTLQQLSSRGEIWGAAKLGRRWTYDRMRLRAWVLAHEDEVQKRKTSTSATGFFMPASTSTGESIDDRLRRAIERKLKGA